ncbi:CGNR zinc finger domain-containing protein [Brevibacterium casei]|uniref:Zinc finger CGNR domain-containing protein n=2 Tax=Brevibacterium casei TaxID=33889 RepID=K9ARA8_9MICO|nr:CGNR zinc finger domain-containing protein [Brevibacterium casei]EKU45167.1 hypothetical protein C272_15862 [Brevibacterium casei S18]KZE14621.1 hypothetical protein AVW13_15595 [Brevibacterium casei]
MSEGRLDFRLGAILATSFTGTLSERQGDRIERIRTPDRLLAWLSISGLDVETCTDDELDLARELREAIHLAATATALGDPLPASALATINDRSRSGRAAPVLLESGERRWELGPPPTVADALSVIAADAISILSGERGGRLALCASPTCRAAFFDTSRSRSRRWCDMNTCGNREKKARFKARHRPSSGAGTAASGADTVAGPR